MNGGLVFLLFGVGVALVITLGVVSAIAARRRRDSFVALAASRGWTYTERDDAWTERFTGVPFGRGHNRRADNVVTGTQDGRPFVAFDYVYYTTETSTDAQGHSSSREVSHTYGVVALTVGVAFPPLEVAPEGFVSRIVGRLTDHDIDLESEDFNRAFTVSCPDRKFASDILHPRMMEFLLNHPDAAFAFQGADLLTVTSGQSSLEEVQQRLALLDSVLDLVPDFVWRAVGER